MSKTLTIITTILITAIVIGGGMYWYMSSSSPSSTKSEQPVKTNFTQTSKPKVAPTEMKYKNSKYGFSFDYNPSQYKITELKSRGGATGDEGDLIRITKIGENCPAVDIFISTATLKQELNDLESRINGNATKITVDNTMATKKSGEITENITPCGSKKTEIVFEHKGNVFVITAFKNWEATLNQILATITL